MIRSPVPARLWWSLIALYLICASAWVWWMSHLLLSRDPSAATGVGNLQQLRWFWLGSAGMWIVLTAMAALLYRGSKKPTTSPGEVAGGGRLQALELRSSFGAATVVLLVAAALRVVVVFTHTPTLSDDIWRYVFDGRCTWSGHNPYVVAPGEIDPTEPRFPGEAELAERINNPELTTIYLPTSQMAFATAVGLTPRGESDPWLTSVVLRLLLSTIELAGVGALMFALVKVDRDVWWAVLYAWHPLAISETAGSGHQDAAGIALMIMALTLCQLRPSRAAGWSMLLAVAAGVKPVVIPVALIMLWGRPVRCWVVAGLVGFGVCAILFGAWLLPDGAEPARHLWITVDNFVNRWAFHGSIYRPLTFIMGQDNDHLAKLICLALVAAAFVTIWLRRVDPWTGTRAFMLAAILFSTTAHPWYLLWALALVPMAPSPAVWVASLTLPLGYWVLGDVVDWTVPGWVAALTYVPVYIVLAGDWLVAGRARWRWAGASM